MSEVQVSYQSLQYLERAIDMVNANVGIVANRVNDVENHLYQVDNQLAELHSAFLQMIIEQRQQAAFQRALTEIIRVRQELEQKFGTQKLVRDSLLGILQSTDTALISAETIKRCSEELMLTTPKYWLSPCLIAIAAWIGGRDKGVDSKEHKLAIRAAQEAVKRDKEKACLLFALVCRRNGRDAECFRWLSKYFEGQSAQATKKSVIAVIDAYSNGVFGEDKDGIVEGYISKWMAELKDEQFEAEQKEYWKNFFNVEGAHVAYYSDGYGVLKEMSVDFDRINNFVSRITAFNNEGGVRDQLRAKAFAEIDVEALRNAVDNQLGRLVNEYEEGEEAALREEEAFFQYVKEKRGDEDWAKEKVELEKAARFDPPVDLVSRLRSSIAMQATTVEEIAGQKTAVLLLKKYIVDTYKEYITENKDAFPEVINLSIAESFAYPGSKFARKSIKWSGTTNDGENLEDLKKELSKVYNTAKEQEIAQAKPSKGVMIAVGIFTLGIGAIVLNNKYKAAKASIEQEYSKRSRLSIAKLEAAVGARVETNKIVRDFCSQDGWDEFKLESNPAIAEVAAAEIAEVLE